MAHESQDITGNESVQHPEKKLLAPRLGRVAEHDTVPETGGRNLRRRLISKFELPKATDKSDKKPETAVIVAEPVPKPVEAKPESKSETAFVEIPLSQARQPAEAFIDLRREQVAEELHKAEPKSAAQAEAAADATLLGNTSRQLEAQSDSATFVETVQAAQSQTLEALHYPAEAAQPIESAETPVEYRADVPMSSFVQSYLEKREQTVRAIAKEQFDKAEEPPEFSQAMQLADLLAYSERIFIDGASLRSMYESNQITEAGLRRITAEYLKGGDVRKALGDEHMRNETKFERDPELRNQLQASYDNVQAANPQSSQDGLTNLHTAPKSSGDVPLAESTDSKEDRHQAEHLFAGAWLILIAVLIVIAGILILR